MITTDLLRVGGLMGNLSRLPIIATLQELDREALVIIAPQPKNAMVKQYQNYSN